MKMFMDKLISYMRIFALYSYQNSSAAGADWAVHIAPRKRETEKIT